MSRCAKCGCEKESPFDGKTVIHDETRCGSLAAPTGSGSGEFYRISRTPVDRTAAIVVSKGERHEPFGKAAVVHIFHSEVCPAIVPDKSLRLTSANLTGIKFGRFTVIGMSRDIKGQENTGGRWVVRCSCGDYEVRTAKSIKNPNNKDDMCRICNKARQTLHWRERVLNCGTKTPNAGTQRPGSPDVSLATETRKPGSLK
jgi:hypothetical protein